MLVLEVEKDDCKKLADFLNSLRITVGGSPNFSAMISFVDVVRWLQDLAVQMAQKYSEELQEEEKENKKAESGFIVKNYSPGASE